MFHNGWSVKNWMECAEFRMAKSSIFAVESGFMLLNGLQKTFLPNQWTVSFGWGVELLTGFPE
jgi:hypothetical protein